MIKFVIKSKIEYKNHTDYLIYAANDDVFDSEEKEVAIFRLDKANPNITMNLQLNREYTLTIE